MTTPTGPGGSGYGGPPGGQGEPPREPREPERDGVPTSGAPQVGAPAGGTTAPLPSPSPTPAMPSAAPPSPSAPPGGSPSPRHAATTPPATPQAPSTPPAGGTGAAPVTTSGVPTSGATQTPRSETYGGSLASGAPWGATAAGAGLGAAAASSGAGGTTPRTAPPGATSIGSLPGGATPLRPGKARRARLVVRRVDPWSVLKFTLLFSLCLLIVFVVAVAALYFALDRMGVFTEVNDFVRELTQASSGGRRTGGVEVPFTASRVIGIAAVIGLVNVVIVTAISTLGAFLYNLCADIVGGIEVTLAERE